MQKERYFQIDFLRFIAAFYVMLFHYSFSCWARGLAEQMSFPALRSVAKYGYLGVDLFFIISGFVIALSIQSFSVSKFVKSRITRLYPAYIFAVCITSLVIILWGLPRFTITLNQFLLNLTMLNGFIGVEHIDGVYWTLLIELKFYFLIFLYLIARRVKHLEIEVFAYIWLIYTIVRFAFPISVFNYADYFIETEWSSYFIAGIMFYSIYSKGFKLKYALPALAALIISIYFGIEKCQLFESRFGHLGIHFSPWVTGCLIAAFYLLMFLISLRRLSYLNRHFLYRLGLLTYPLYLVHQNIGYIMFTHMAPVVNKYVLLSATCILMVVSAYLINVLIEVPVSRILRRQLENIEKLFSRAGR